MRGIKFRAWEKEMKVMIIVDDISFELRLINANSAFRYFEEVELMQFTGLKDKNDVEIYEGDIVDCFNDGLSVVLFNKGRFGMFTYKHDSVSFYTFNELYGDFEVIGNVYENKELLE